MRTNGFGDDARCRRPLACPFHEQLQNPELSRRQRSDMVADLDREALLQDSHRGRREIPDVGLERRAFTCRRQILEILCSCEPTPETQVQERRDRSGRRMLASDDDTCQRRLLQPFKRRQDVESVPANNDEPCRVGERFGDVRIFERVSQERCLPTVPNVVRANPDAHHPQISRHVSSSGTSYSVEPTLATCIDALPHSDELTALWFDQRVDELVDPAAVT